MYCLNGFSLHTGRYGGLTQLMHDIRSDGNDGDNY